MSTDDNITVAILREIRDEIRITRTDLRTEISELRTEVRSGLSDLRTEVQATNQRLDGTNERLDGVEGAIKDLAGQQLILTRYVKNSVDRHETAIGELRERMTRVESRLDK